MKVLIGNFRRDSRGGPHDQENWPEILGVRRFLLPEYLFDIDMTATIEDAIYYIHKNYQHEPNRDHTR